MNMKCNLKRSVALLAFGGLAALLSGCVVAPLGYEAYGTYPSGPVVVAPPPVVVAPGFYGYRGNPGYRGYRGNGYWR